MSWLTRFFEKRKDHLADETQAHLEMDIADRISRGEPFIHLGLCTDGVDTPRETGFGPVMSLR